MSERPDNTQWISAADRLPANDSPLSGEEQRARLLVAVIAGVIAGLPAGWLLAYLAPMPYFLGLFFFLVLGMLVGAIMCRVARKGAPFPRRQLSRVSMLVAVVIWCTVLVVEYRWFADTAAQFALKNSLLSEMKESPEQFRAQVRAATRDQLRTRYWPGSLPGYVRWAATSGRMELPRGGSTEPVQFENVQRPRAWLIRMAASLALLIFAVDALFSTLGPKKSGEGEQTAEDADTAR